MAKLDNHLREARPTLQPAADFTDRVMESLSPPKTWHKLVSAVALPLAAVFLLVISPQLRIGAVSLFDQSKAAAWQISTDTASIDSELAQVEQEIDQLYQLSDLESEQ